MWLLFCTTTFNEHRLYGGSHTHTVGPHDVLQRLQVLDASLVAAEDLGSGTKVVGELLSVPLPHLPIAAQSVDLLVEGHIVGRPIACKQTGVSSEFCKYLQTCDNGTMEEAKCCYLFLPLLRAWVWSEYSTRPGICSTTVRAPSSMLRPSLTLLRSRTMYWLLYVPTTERDRI